MTTALFNQLASESSLHLATATYGRENLNVAYGFRDVDDAHEYATQYDLELVICSRSVHHKNDYWKVIDEGRSIAREGFDSVIIDAVGNQGTVWEDEEEYWTDGGGPSLELLKPEEDVDKALERLKRIAAILEEAKNLDEDERLIEWDTNTEVYNAFAGECTVDNVDYIIGVYDPNRRDPEDITVNDLEDLAEVINLAAETNDYPHEIVDKAIEDNGWEDLQDDDNDVCRDEEGYTLTINGDGKAYVEYPQDEDE